MKRICIALLLLGPLYARTQIGDSSRREVKLQGGINFRDIGGYATAGGKHVKWGRLYRSAAINRLTDQDLAKLQQLGIHYVVDFRGPYEVAAAPDRLPANATRLSLPAGSETIGDSASMRKMLQANSILIFYGDLRPFTDRYKPLFDELLTVHPDSSLLFHCTAGKDRTGIAAALILLALGVNEQKIMEDYTATDYYRSRENERMIPVMLLPAHNTKQYADQGSAAG